MFWNRVLRAGAMPPVTEAQVNIFTTLLLEYVEHVFTDTGPHRAGVCDVPSIFTKTLPCEDDRERLHNPNTVGFWVRVGRPFPLMRDICRIAGFDEELAFPSGLRMCIAQGKVDIRISNAHPFQTLYDSTEY
jgi:hypothetical protein